MTTEFAICLNELSNYNNGELVYKWFHLDNYADASEFWAAVNEWLAACPHPYGGECEEWNLADVEGIPSKYYGEYSFDAKGFYQYKELAEEIGEEKLEAYLSIFNQLPESTDQFSEKFFCETECSEGSNGFYGEIGHELADLNEIESQLPEHLASYFDFEAYGRDEFINTMGESKGFVFWTC